MCKFGEVNIFFGILNIFFRGVGVIFDVLFIKVWVSGFEDYGLG